MFLGEFFEGLEDVVLDHGGIFGGVGRGVRHDGGGKVGAID